MTVVGVGFLLRLDKRMAVVLSSEDDRGVARFPNDKIVFIFGFMILLERMGGRGWL